MSVPMLNTSTEKLIHSMSTDLHQSLLLSGDAGLGLLDVATYMCTMGKTKSSVVQPEKDEKVDIDKGTITIDAIRKLQSSAQIKTNTKNAIIINKADTMTIQAQNAFLKLLEEPSKNIHFILVSHATSKLLPTIISRVKPIRIKRITKSQSENLLDSLKITDGTKRQQILFMAEGLPNEIVRLCEDQQYFDKKAETIRDAREILRGGAYQKLVIAHKYKDDRPSALMLLQDVSKILEHSLNTSYSPDTFVVINKVLNIQQQVVANGNIRLCLAQFIT
jgi:DNA polymerase III delta prime subunit